MAPAWDADIEIDLARAQRLIATQFPELDHLPVRLMGQGWDNCVYLVGGEIGFRFPRRTIAEQLLRNETQILPLLGSALPLRIPVPRWIGRPTAEYPHMFMGYPWLAGQSACQGAWTEQQRAALAGPLGHFLRELHTLPATAEQRTWAPGDELDRAGVARRATLLLDTIAAAPELLRHHGFDPIQVAAQLKPFQQLALPVAPTCWVHGDLYPRHLLVDSQHQLCGVIDWGDVHLGDAAVDLGIAWTFLPRTAHAAFCAAYGSIDAQTWERARFRAFHYGILLLEYGTAVGDAALVGLACYALRQAARQA